MPTYEHIAAALSEGNAGEARRLYDEVMAPGMHRLHMSGERQQEIEQAIERLEQRAAEAPTPTRRRGRSRG